MRNPVFIIAEAGVNHNGSLGLAFRLIDAAARAGVDAVKFQSYNTDKLVTKTAPKAEYQKKNEDSNSQYEMLKQLELSEEAHIQLKDYAEEKNLEFMSTPFDHESIELLTRIGVKRFKVGSGDLTNVPYLRHLAATKIPIILSTGMANMAEVQEAVRVILDTGFAKENLSVLHATTEYPAPYNEVNLMAMKTMEKKLKLSIGYSDHTPGIEIPIAAVALGAEIIEKHFTLDRSLPGPDHKASLEPDELKQMVISIRKVEQSIGSGTKIASESEEKNRPIARKSLVAATVIKKGARFTEENLCVKRPGSGISPLKWDEWLGQRADQDYEIDDLIQ